MTSAIDNDLLVLPSAELDDAQAFNPVKPEFKHQSLEKSKKCE